MSAKSLYGEYIKAREGFEIIEFPFGFASYKVNGIECYIRDVYIVPEMRKQGAASILCDTIKTKAKELNCKCLITSVCPSANDSTESLKAVLGYGFKLSASQIDFIIFKMDI